MTPLDPILEDVQRGIDAALYYLALNLALSIPDICSGLEKNPGHDRYRKIQDRYEKWCRDYLIPGRYSRFTAEDCWVLRGGIVHNAMLVKGRESAKYDRIFFTLPERGGRTFHDCQMNAAIQLDLVRFCGDMIDAAKQWLAAKGNDPIVAASLPDLVRLRPDGLPGFIEGGFPVIA